MSEWFLNAIGEAFSSLFGWICAIVATLVFGFCAGYWIGHGEITEARKTLVAFAWIPLLWLGNPEMFFAYAMTALVWYLPLHFESGWLRISGVVANFLVWLIVVELIVVKTADGKFFRY